MLTLVAAGGALCAGLIRPRLSGRQPKTARHHDGRGRRLPGWLRWKLPTLCGRPKAGCMPERSAPCVPAPAEHLERRRSCSTVSHHRAAGCARAAGRVGLVRPPPPRARRRRWSRRGAGSRWPPRTAAAAPNCRVGLPPQPRPAVEGTGSVGSRGSGAITGAPPSLAATTTRCSPAMPATGLRRVKVVYRRFAGRAGDGSGARRPKRIWRPTGAPVRPGRPALRPDRPRAGWSSSSWHQRVVAAITSDWFGAAPAGDDAARRASPGGPDAGRSVGAGLPAAQPRSRLRRCPSR